MRLRTPSPNRPSRRPAARLTVNRLEDRTVPYGNVMASFSGGVLTLTGDLSANDVTLSVSGGQATVTGNVHTTINNKPEGTPFVSGPGLQSVTANLRGGGDTLGIDPTADFVVPGAVTVNFADGDATLALGTAGKLDVGRLAVSSAADNLHSLDHIYTVRGGAGSTVRGDVSFNYASGVAHIGLNGLAVRGNLTVAGGTGGRASDSTPAGVTVDKAATFKFGDAADTIDLLGSAVGTLSVSGKNPTVRLAGLSIPAVASAPVRDALVVASTAAGGKAVVAWAGPNSVGGTVRVTGDAAALTAKGEASDALSVSGNVFVTAKADATLSADKAGRFAVWAADPKTGAPLARNVTVTAGTGVTVNLNPVGPSSVSGNLSVTGKDAGNTVVLGPSVGVAGNLAVALGAGADKVAFRGVTVGGTTTVNLGQGANELVVDNGAVFQKAFTAALGDGGNTVTIARDTGSANPVTFNGAFRITLGKGADKLYLGRDPLRDEGDANSQVLFSTRTTNTIDGGLGAANTFYNTAGSYNYHFINLVNWQFV